MWYLGCEWRSTSFSSFIYRKWSCSTWKYPMSTRPWGLMVWIMRNDSSCSAIWLVSVLNFISAKITGVQGHSRASYDASARQIVREKRSVYLQSNVVTLILHQFHRVWFFRRRPSWVWVFWLLFYPPFAATHCLPHRRHESALNIMSVSSYEHGSLDPFEYGLVYERAPKTCQAFLY